MSRLFLITLLLATIIAAVVGEGLYRADPIVIQQSREPPHAE